jgi:light-regulated signal transduction histidine kinase (bacteriophytochrome)
MYGTSSRSTPATNQMKMVRNSLECIRKLLAGESAQGEESKAQIQQLAQLEQLLIDEEARLDAVDKVLEEFNYSVAHELFAPLRRISGFTREIKQRFADEIDLEGIKCLNNILDSSQHMNELIEALMQVSRVAHLDLQLSSVDLSDIANGVIEELRQHSPERQAEVTIKPQLMAAGDGAMLKTAMRLLLENAWKYSIMQDPARVEFGEVLIEQERVFYVRDNGVGFDMSESDRLFHPFQRLHDRNLFPGKGIGLTTVKRIIDRHGGRIWAEAAPDRGATFFFTL